MLPNSCSAVSWSTSSAASSSASTSCDRSVLAEEHDADASASPTECSVTAEQLTAYLRRRFPDSPDVRVTQLEVVPGGRSKETMLVSLAGTTELPAEVDRPQGPTGRAPRDRAADEFAILRAVHAHGGVPVAEPFFADDMQNVGRRRRRGTLLVMAAGTGRQGGRVLPGPGRAAARVPTGHRDASWRPRWPTCTRSHSTRWPGPPSTWQASVSEASLTAAVERHGRPHRRPDGPAHRRRPAGAPVAARPHRRRRSIRPAVSPAGRRRTAQHRSSIASASPHWWTGRRPPSAHRRASWQRPGPPPRR